MSQTAEAVRQFTDFITQKCRQELLDECKTNAPRILDKISVETLAQVFNYHDCPEWQRYVIDLDGEIDPTAFSHENPLYRHTPRIFKTGADNPRFGIEKLHRTLPYAETFRDAMKQAVTFASEQGIIIVYEKSNPADSVYLIEERDQLKVKFAYFNLRMIGGCENG